MKPESKDGTRSKVFAPGGIYFLMMLVPTGMILGGMWLLAQDVIHWLKLGVWTPVLLKAAIADFLGHELNPDSITWVGLRIITSWILPIPMSFVLMAVGYAIVFLGEQWRD